jgi:hypothetical protein
MKMTSKKKTENNKLAFTRIEPKMHPILTPSEILDRCKNGEQNCHICPDLTCGDNHYLDEKSILRVAKYLACSCCMSITTWEDMHQDQRNRAMDKARKVIAAYLGVIGNER